MNKNNNCRSICLDGRNVLYEFKRKKVKNINLRIRPDCSVYVSANSSISDSAIKEFLIKKSDFILKALYEYAEIIRYRNSEHDYVTGESFRYLGKELRLVVIQGKNSVGSDGLNLALSVTDVKDIALKKKLIDKWYNMQCKMVSSEIIAETYRAFKKYNMVIPKLSLRDMVSRWGSCQPKRGVITLNKRLIEAPRNVFEYVVMHEFVHFLYSNHSNKFYEMLSVLMPDWKLRKNLLETTVFYNGACISKIPNNLIQSS